MTFLTPNDDQEEDRRKFLATCGRFAAVTPPTLTLLLSTSLTSNAVASSNWRNNNQGGNNNYQGGNNNNQGGNNNSQK